MNIVLAVLLWGLVAGIIHFVVVGVLYQNPLVAKIYKAEADNPAVKKWLNQKEYILKMFLGTQIEVYILAVAYIYLRQFFPEPNSWITALSLGGIFAGIRIYPRFWNMWIQSAYPNKLLIVEFINGIISTFVIIVAMRLLPV